MYIPELSEKTYLGEKHQGVSVRSVAWLGAEIPATGDFDPALRPALAHLCRYHFLEDFSMGVHQCEICKQESVATETMHARNRPRFDLQASPPRPYCCKNEAWLEVGGLRYTFPLMIEHYIGRHGYLPPAAFMAALREYWFGPAGEQCRDGRCAAERADWSGTAWFYAERTALEAAGGADIPPAAE